MGQVQCSCKDGDPHNEEQVTDNFYSVGFIEEHQDLKSKPQHNVDTTDQDSASTRATTDCAAREVEQPKSEPNSTTMHLLEIHPAVDDGESLPGTLSPTSPQSTTGYRGRGQEKPSFEAVTEMFDEDGITSEGDFSDDGTRSVSSIDSMCSIRSNKKRQRRKLPVTATMGFTPSQSLQLVIDHPDKKLGNFYSMKTDKDSKLGSGAFGTVRLGKVKATGAVRAIKAINKEQMKTRIGVLKQEIEITKMVDHPNLIKLYEIFEDDDNLYIVMELCRGGTLEDRVLKTGAPLSEKDAAIAMQQVFRGIYYMHKNGLMHRDLKSENVLCKAKDGMEKNILKVTDFGLSCQFKEGQLFNNRAGTPSHMAPEVLAKSYDEKCDLWSLGVMIYYLLSGRHPFEARTEDKIFERIEKGKFKLEPSNAWSGRSEESVALIKKLLVPAEKRLGIKEAMNDQWFVKHLPPHKDVDIKPQILNNLRTFRSENRLKRAALHVVASMLLEADIKGSREVFMSLDVDGDGSLSVAELKARLARASAKETHLRDQDVEALVNKMYGGEDDSELVDFTYTEFLAATFDRKLCMPEPIIKAAFNSFDKNGDQNISMSELANGHLLGALSLEELARTFEDLDNNGDCYIDYEEFRAMMRKGVDPPSEVPKKQTNRSLGGSPRKAKYN